MIDTSAYILRISQANPVQLVVINFELVIEFLQAALSDDGSDDVYYSHIQKAKNALEQLIQSLDFEVSVSHDFYEIYNYAYRRLCEIHFKSADKAATTLNELVELMQALLVGWQDAASKAEAESAAPQGDAPKIYAGLTYGKNGQAVEYIDENKDRGYMA